MFVFVYRPFYWYISLVQTQLRIYDSSIHSNIEHVALGPVSLTWFNFNPAWINNYIHYKVWDKIAHPFLNFNGATVEVWEMDK